MSRQIHLITASPSLLNQTLAELRDTAIQQDRMRFRANLEKVGEMLAYEISKRLAYALQEVTTPLGVLEMQLLAEQPVLVSIMRAGLPVHNGFLRMFDRADNGFVAAYRHHTSESAFDIRVEYSALPELDGRTLILIDPMIATGKSIVLSYKEMLHTVGAPAKVFIAGVIASEEGLEYVQRHIPEAEIFVTAIDKELTAKSAYIVPGLGDAGDLAFGPK